MARRGLQAYAVPSARAGQRPDPSARREALGGIMTGGFLMAVIAAVLVIVVAAPEYAEPVAGGSLASPSGEPSPSPSAAVDSLVVPSPDSKPPNKLGGYRWPVRGGTLVRFYDWDKGGDFSIEDRRVHAGLDIEWFCRPRSLRGAIVKAAHRGTIVAAGTEWAEHVGFDGDVDPYYRTLRKQRGGLPKVVVIDDGNGYRSVYKYLDEVLVQAEDVVKAGHVIGTMGSRDGSCHIEYQLVRMDGDWMKVAEGARKQGLPGYAREHVDPLVVMKLEAKRAPAIKKAPPSEPPRLSVY